MNVPTELTRKEWGFRQRDFSGRKKNIRFLNSGQIMIDRSSSYSLRGYMPRRLLFRVNVISGVKNRKCMFILKGYRRRIVKRLIQGIYFFMLTGIFLSIQKRAEEEKERTDQDN